MVWAFSLQEHCFVPVRQEHCFVGRSIILSTGAWFCRPDQCYVDRSMFVIDRSMPTRALWCRQEHCFVGMTIILSTGALFCRQEHAWGLGPVWGACLGGLGACWRPGGLLAAWEACLGSLGGLWSLSGLPGSPKTSAGVVGLDFRSKSRGSAPSTLSGRKGEPLPKFNH